MILINDNIIQAKKKKKSKNAWKIKNYSFQLDLHKSIRNECMNVWMKIWLDKHINRSIQFSSCTSYINDKN